MKSASEGAIDPGLLTELTDLLDSSFPKTRSFIASRVGSDPAGGFSDEGRAVAWAEAHAVPSGEGARVPGSWTEKEIAASINECFAEARRRAGL